MDEKHLAILVESLKHYFKEYHEASVEVSVPFIKKESSEIYQEYTGCISISGEYRGAIYLSCSRRLIEEIARMVLGANDLDEKDIVDMTGEFTNTIAGNARKQLGSGFEISVPMVITGSFSDINLPKFTNPIYVIPFVWKDEKAYMFVGLAVE